MNKKNGANFPTRKIRSVVRTVVPKGADFRLRVIDSNIGGMKVVRVVTPAWEKLRPSDRIFKIITAANALLSPAELKGILRFSVLTPEEARLLADKPSRKATAHR